MDLTTGCLLWRLLTVSLVSRSRPLKQMQKQQAQAALAGSLRPCGLGSRFLSHHPVAYWQLLLQQSLPITRYFQQSPDQRSGAKFYNYVEDQTSANNRCFTCLRKLEWGAGSTTRRTDHRVISPTTSRSLRWNAIRWGESMRRARPARNVVLPPDFTTSRGRLLRGRSQDQTGTVIQLTLPQTRKGASYTTLPAFV